MLYTYPHLGDANASKKKIVSFAVATNWTIKVATDGCQKNTGSAYQLPMQFTMAKIVAKDLSLFR